jgi:negative regulator of sigma E activity
MNPETHRTPGARENANCGQDLSCLIDGELDETSCARLLERLRTDEGARREWMMLTAAGDALRSHEVGAWHSVSFVVRLSQALTAEPTVLAPRARPERRLLLRVVLPGAAAAAAFVVLGVVVVPQLREDATAARTASVAPAARVQAAAAAADVQADAALEAYLLAHREAAGGSVMPRSAAYLRTANTPVSAAR